MATAIEARHTPEELLEITDRPPPDLVEGQFVEREPMGQEADEIGSRFIGILLNYAGGTLPAAVNGPHAGYQIFPDDPDKVRFPDVSFTRRERLPEGKSVKGHSRVVPDLVVEVISPNDSATGLRSKIRDFLDAGVLLIWVVNPETRDVEVFRRDGTGGLKAIGDILDGEDVLPGFSCPVAKLFG